MEAGLANSVAADDLEEVPEGGTGAVEAQRETVEGDKTAAQEGAEETAIGRPAVGCVARRRLGQTI